MMEKIKTALLYGRIRNKEECIIRFAVHILDIISYNFNVKQLSESINVSRFTMAEMT